MNALILSATRRRDQVVILTGPAIGAKSVNRFASTGKAILRALFSARASVIVAVACAAAVWAHIITIDDTLEAQAAIARDCIYAMPWGVAGMFRAINEQKGGEA